MIKRTTLYFLAVFVVFALGAYFVVRNNKNSEENQITPTPGAEFLFDQKDENITMLSINGSAGDSITLKIDDEGRWIFTTPAEKQVDENSLASSLSQFKNSRIVTKMDPAPDEKDIGLENPAYILEVSFEGGDQFYLKIGNQTPTGSGYYTNLNNKILLVVDKFGIEAAIRMIDNPPVLINQDGIPATNDIP